ncbi:LmrA/YxaF family transcription factor [Pseudomonas chlororaphis subsp. piscium]
MAEARSPLPLSTPSWFSSAIKIHRSAIHPLADIVHAELLRLLWRQEPAVKAELERARHTDAAQLSEDHYVAGCPIAIVTLERRSHSEVLTAACGAAFESWQRELAQALEDRGFKPKRASEIALSTLVVLAGCLVIGRASISTEAFEAGLAMLLIQLGEQGAAPPLPATPIS